MTAVITSHNPIPASLGVFLDIKQVAALLDLTPRTIYREIQRGNFPRPFHLTPRKTRWEMSVIQSHLSKLRAASA